MPVPRGPGPRADASHGDTVHVESALAPRRDDDTVAVDFESMALHDDTVNVAGTPAALRARTLSGPDGSDHVPSPALAAAPRDDRDS